MDILNEIQTNQKIDEFNFGKITKKVKDIFSKKKNNNASPEKFTDIKPNQIPSFSDVILHGNPIYGLRPDLKKGQKFNKNTVITWVSSDGTYFCATAVERWYEDSMLGALIKVPETSAVFNIKYGNDKEGWRYKDVGVHMWLINMSVLGEDSTLPRNTISYHYGKDGVSNSTTNIKKML